MRSFLMERNPFTVNVKPATGGSSKGAYCQLLKIELDLGVDTGASSIEERLENALKINFFEHSNNFIELISTELNRLKYR